MAAKLESVQENLEKQGHNDAQNADQKVKEIIRDFRKIEARVGELGSKTNIAKHLARDAHKTNKPFLCKKLIAQKELDPKEIKSNKELQKLTEKEAKELEAIMKGIVKTDTDMNEIPEQSELAYLFSLFALGVKYNQNKEGDPPRPFLTMKMINDKKLNLQDNRAFRQGCELALYRAVRDDDEKMTQILVKMGTDLRMAKQHAVENKDQATLDKWDKVKQKTHSKTLSKVVLPRKALEAEFAFFNEARKKHEEKYKKEKQKEEQKGQDQDDSKKNDAVDKQPSENKPNLKPQ